MRPGRRGASGLFPPGDVVALPVVRAGERLLVAPVEKAAVVARRMLDAVGGPTFGDVECLYPSDLERRLI